MSANSKPRPKPWETHAPLDIQESRLENNSLTKMSSETGNHSIHSDDNSNDPPPRPAELASEPYTSFNPMYSNSSPYGIGTGIGGGMYGNGMYGGGYGSMYGGGLGSMYGGGYGGYGSMYGNGYGGGYMNGGSGSPGGFGESTQATFQLIESLIGTVTGFAQMLESTYMATHSSFFSMVSVAEQFSYLKEVLGSFFGIFALMKFVRRILFYVTKGRMGTPPPSRTVSNGGSSDMVNEFHNYKRDENSKRKRISWKPLIFFLAAVFGFPYALNKFITRVQTMQKGKIGTKQMGAEIDPSKLEFARALYDFTPENPQLEAPLKRGELMAIITKQHPSGKDSEWWKVRTKSGYMGYVPFNYVEIIKRHKRIEDVRGENVGSL